MGMILVAKATALTQERGEWVSLPNTSLLNDPAWNPAKLANNGGTGPQYIFEYSGGSFDSIGNRLLVHGGGHGSYRGNEVYAFNLDVGGNDYEWVVLGSPSTKVNLNEGFDCVYDCHLGYLADGLPVAHHSYQMIGFHPTWNAMISPVQGAFSATGGCYSNAYHFNFNRFNLASQTWTTNLPKIDTLASDGGSGSYFNIVLVDSSGNVWLFQEGGYQKVFEFTLSNSTWYDRFTGTSLGGWGEGVGAIDIDRDIAVTLGDGVFVVWDLTNETTPVKLSTSFTGPSSLVDASAPGFTWDSSNGLFVGWAGIEGETGSVYALRVDPGTDTYHFTKLDPADSNVFLPSTRQANGSWGPFGRWAYSPSQNLYVLADRMTENVKLYKLPVEADGL